jgi:hypothetical protein
MSWKQFLKPDRRKIIFFIIFSIYDVYFYFTGACPMGNIISNCAKIADMFTLIYITPVYLVNLFYPPHDLFSAFYLLFLAFAYHYIISCLIVWIYDKYKKRK